ncbi:pyridine nucleotide-disulfide oxidoreductase-like protein [Byssothecium circinans]|uniref:Pyridine nucleotide-disulfide oxidoreductase-like protein n=1 Tax=Byssothecium circinans TaxID=147558 RepID=A0A6A5TNQ7_9PLEO|nr:pyridine nucleotide-disulfide oxidoreductase-like protein [Byssothecium circinans]
MTAVPTVDPQKLAAVRQHYAEEAKKRQRPEGSAQFLQLIEAHEERLRSLSEDPWADHEALNAKSSPTKDNAVYKAFVLGAGFGGLLFSIRLIESGVATADDIRLVDAAGGVADIVTFLPRYPGLHCDLESYMYLPLLEETGYIPKLKYSTGAEIRQHAERIASKWNLTDKALFHTTVKTVSWDDDSELWTIQFTEGRGPGIPPIEHQIRAQYVYLAAGVLTRPKVPRIPDLHTFEGGMFHTARWNYDITGGSQEDQTLSKLRDKRVAVVGTAATAIGVIPEVGKYAKELFVIQRTPAYVKPRNQKVTNRETFNVDVAYRKGWQLERQLNWNSYLTNSAKPGQKNLVEDGWTDMPALERHVTAFHALDLPHMEAVRARIDREDKDPKTAEKLKPWYPTWCKRPTFSDTYLPLFNEPNVHLVDTDGKGPSRATRKGLVVGDQDTGFQVGRVGSPALRTNTVVTGRNGRSLEEKWSTLGASTLHGYLTNGFPNLFFSGASQATVTGNNIMMLNLIANHVTYMIASAEKRVGNGKRAIVEATREVEEKHSEEVAKRAPFYASVAGCTPGYFNGYGDGSDVTDEAEKRKNARGAVWSEGTVSFLKLIGQWREEGSLKGLDIVPAKETEKFRAVL